MENKIQNYNETIFESIKHIDEFGNEYWSARELQKVLEYKKWENFEKVITKAKDACINSNMNVFEQLPEVGKLSKRANNTEVMIDDYKLSRYACYLIAQNGDSRKKVIALAQTYFAIQTRKQEIEEQRIEDEKNKVIEENFEVIHIDIENCYKLWYDKTIRNVDEQDRGLVLIGTLLTLNKMNEFKECMEDINMEDKIKENITDAVEEFSKDKDLFIYYNSEQEKEKIHRTDVILAKKEGIKEGINSRNIEIAKNLLKNNVDIKIIIDSTGLSKEEIEKLKLS